MYLSMTATFFFAKADDVRRALVLYGAMTLVLGGGAMRSILELLTKCPKVAAASDGGFFCDRGQSPEKWRTI